MEKQEAIRMCKEWMHRYVMIRTADGMAYDGIIEHVDDENVYLAVPIGSCEEGESGFAHQMYMANAYPAANAPLAMMNMQPAVYAMPAAANAQIAASSVYPDYSAAHVGVVGANTFAGYRQAGFPGYGFGGWYGYGYPSFYGPRRRFRRLTLPLAALLAISLLPYY